VCVCVSAFSGSNLCNVSLFGFLLDLVLGYTLVRIRLVPGSETNLSQADGTNVNASVLDDDTF
jgi:hypothetical protein